MPRSGLGVDLGLCHSLVQEGWREEEWCHGVTASQACMQDALEAQRKFENQRVHGNVVKPKILRTIDWAEVEMLNVCLSYAHPVWYVWGKYVSQHAGTICECSNRPACGC